jgi:4-aminobutyrate aminotransferase-like enzyme
MTGRDADGEAEQANGDQGDPCGAVGGVAAMQARRAALLGPAYRLFYDRPLHLVRGDGVWLFDAQGAAYLDGYNNVASVGHCHPHVVSAIAAQAGRLATHTRYLHDGPLDLAARLLDSLPEPLGHMMFTCTGSEANDLAFRIAQSATGGRGVVVTQTAYHGVTEAAAAFSPALRLPGGLPAHVRVVPAPLDGPDPTGRFAADVAAAFADLGRAGVGPAMFLCDSIFASDGVVDGPPGLLRGAAEAARAVGALYVADEVQAGFGRTGEGMWGFTRHGVQPDIVTMGKPMGNGYPVAGLAVRPEHIARFGRDVRYFNTFGGNPVAMAAAGAVLDVIAREGLIANAAATGAHLRARLRDVQAGHPALGAVRGAGLFAGVDVVTPDGSARPDPQNAAAIVNTMRASGVLISTSGLDGNVLKIRPPLVFRPEHADRLVAALEQALHGGTRGHGTPE